MRLRTASTFAIATAALVAAPPPAAAAPVAPPPAAVSPTGTVTTGTPTFIWSLVDGASGFEVALYAFGPGGEPQPERLVGMRLPAGAAAWTLPAESALAPGERYAWSVRAITRSGAGAWSDPVLFRVAGAPSQDEVRSALATLRRHLEAGEAAGGRRGPAGVAGASRTPSARPAGLTSAPPPGAAGLGGKAAPGSPPPSPSLTVGSDIALGAASNLFKDGDLFLWDDTSDNTALGRGALAATTSGADNTALGRGALLSNTEGIGNVAIGSFAGHNLGYNVEGAGLDHNVFIANPGEREDTRTIRIGTQAHQDATFIAGIHSAAPAGDDEHTVCVDNAGQLGACGDVISSLRFKQDVQDLEGATPKLLELRPVTFRYREGILGGPERERVGLVAEEVAELFPELVLRDRDGTPFGVRYELLSVLLLSELQRQHRALERQQAADREHEAALAEVAALRERLAALEAGSPAAEDERPWWRRIARRGRASP